MEPQLGSPIAYFPVLTKITGCINAGLVLAQLLYWSRIMNGSEFYKTNKQLSFELGLTEWQVKAGKKILVNMGIVEIRVKGMPKKTFYRVNSEVIKKLIQMDASIPLSGGIHPNEKMDTPANQDASIPLSGGIHPEEKNTKEKEKIKREEEPPLLIPKDFLDFANHEHLERCGTPFNSTLGRSKNKIREFFKQNQNLKIVKAAFSLFLQSNDPYLEGSKNRGIPLPRNLPVFVGQAIVYLEMAVKIEREEESKIGLLKNSVGENLSNADKHEGIRRGRFLQLALETNHTLNGQGVLKPEEIEQIQSEVDLIFKN
jgi:hypothetical protein